MSWLAINYQKLQDRYAGQWVVIVQNQVKFADPNLEKAFDRYEDIKKTNPGICEIFLVDKGEASFY